MTLAIKRKTYQSVEFKAVDADLGIAEMIVSVFSNVDSGGEVVLPGFFNESLATRRTSDGRPRVKGVWSHDWKTPVAKTLDAKELEAGDERLPESIRDLGGLWVQGQFNMETQRGREAFSDLKFGSIDEFSIGYQVLEDRFDPKTGTRYLIKGDLFEWSPVLLGMNEATALIGTKTAEQKSVGAPDGSYEALSQVLGDAFRAVKIPDGQHGYCYVVATFPEYFIASLWMADNDNNEYWKVSYVKNDDGTVTLGTPQQVEPHTEFTPVKGLGLPYESHSARVVSSVAEFVKRTKAGSAIRRAEKDGRPLSDSRKSNISGVSGSLRQAADELETYLVEEEPKAARIKVDTLRLRSESDRILARVTRELGARL